MESPPIVAPSAFNETLIRTDSFGIGPTDIFSYLLGWVGFLLPIINSSPYIQESIRFFFLGTVLETGRRIFQWTLDRFTSGFFVTAHFQQGDWSYDWLNEFLSAQEIWTNSREYRVTASNIEKEWTCAPGTSSSTEKTSLMLGEGRNETHGDGQPRPLYFPSSEMPQVLRWRGHWVQISRKPGVIPFNSSTEEGGSLTLTVYTRRKKVLDELVEEARRFYIGTQKPPLAAQTKKSNLTLKAVFEQSDYTYNWLLEFLNSNNAWVNASEVAVTAKSAEQKWGMDLGGSDRDEKLRAYYRPCSQSPHLWNWNGVWIQVLRSPGSRDYRTGREEGASITLTLYTGRKETLDELVAAAAAQYWETSSRRVTVHMCESYGDWGAVITKQIRPMDSVILPKGMTDLMVDDLREFLDNKDWYAKAGIPWRRGVLLWGPPGTGKSTTVHAIAGELQLEIYCVPLSSNTIDDASLQRLVSATPPGSLLLLEDLDCAFPPRENEEDEESALKGGAFNSYEFGRPKSNVTLSGLLNLLDSVSSEEGRIVFATTNHLDRIDAALLRPGRMDLRVEYKNANRQQIIDLFARFYSQELMTQTTKSDQDAAELLAKPRTIEISEEAAKLVKRSDNSNFLTAVPTQETVAELAKAFADKLPEDVYSIAQLQGFLLCSKRDPHGALKNIDEWLEERKKEQTDKEERLAKRAVERAKWFKMEKYREKRQRQMELDAEKELLEEAEGAEKEEKDDQEAAEADEKSSEKADEDKVETEEKKEEAHTTEKATVEGSSDKDSEPEMVEAEVQQ